MIYLYMKTHNKTGLCYLGKTKQDPFKYQGSGKRWKNHIKKHGSNDVSTVILGVFETNEELCAVSIPISNSWNIVGNPIWANLKIEEGSGGDNSRFIDYSKLARGKGLTYEERYGETKGNQLRQKRRGKFTEEHKMKLSAAKAKRIVPKIQCTICGDSFSSNHIAKHQQRTCMSPKLCIHCSHQVPRTKYASKFCSRKCYVEHRRDNQSS